MNTQQNALKPAVSPDPEALARYAEWIRQPVHVARRIFEQEAKDKAAHSGRNVHDGYDYDRQEWCGCDYCKGAR